ncbi:MAG: 6-methylsalicylate decarboxylase [Sphingomonadales bacterium]|jgi:predicted TIM-barrel fold metal-dependent hydrolase|nr:6-methylsalicylate decarboxylase [Sphingomonadales bacterium]
MDRRHILSMALGGGLAAMAAAAPVRLLGAAAARRRRGIVDVHAHLAIPSYLALLAQAGVKTPGYSTAAGAAAPTSGGKGADSPEAMAQRVALMDGAGVVTQLLSQSLGPYVADEAVAVRAARIANDRYAALARAHPGRFLGLASLPLPHVDAALAELRRALDELGLAGAALHATCLGTSIADPRFAPLFAEMNRRRALLCLHPSVNGLLSPLVLDWRLEAAAGPLLEDSVVALQLFAANIPILYPDVRIVVPHLGGGLASMLDRLDNQLHLSIPNLAARPSEMARRLYYDTVSHGSAPALHAAVEAFGADRLLPGSDFPVLLSFEPYAATFGYVVKALKKPEADLILYRNAEALLHPWRAAA